METVEIGDEIGFEGTVVGYGKDSLSVCIPKRLAGGRFPKGSDVYVTVKLLKKIEIAGVVAPVAEVRC